jgi:hypothetical protein
VSGQQRRTVVEAETGKQRTNELSEEVQYSGVGYVMSLRTRQGRVAMIRAPWFRRQLVPRKARASDGKLRLVPLSAL